LFDIGRVAEIDAVGEADIIGTGRIQTFVNPVMAEIALDCDLLFVVKANGMVRAFIDAKLAPGAFLSVEDDDVVFPFHDGLRRTYLCTGGLIAVFADVYAPYEIELPVHHFRAIRPDRQILHPIGCINRIEFLFAGYLTGPASPAGELFDNQCMLIHGWPPV